MGLQQTSPPRCCRHTRPGARTAATCRRWRTSDNQHVHLGCGRALQLSWMTQGHNHSKVVKRHKLKESNAVCGFLKQSQQTEQLKVSQALEDLVKSHTWLCLLLQSPELPTTQCSPKPPSGCSTVSYTDALPADSFRPEPARCLSPEVPHPAAAGHTSTLLARGTLPVTQELGCLLPLERRKLLTKVVSRDQASCTSSRVFYGSNRSLCSVKQSSSGIRRSAQLLLSKVTAPDHCKTLFSSREVGNTSSWQCQLSCSTSCPVEAALLLMSYLHLLPTPEEPSPYPCPLPALMVSL